MVLLKRASETDIPLLTRMNRNLIEDENAGNSMTENELRTRMRGFIDGPYDAYLILDEKRPAGYILVRTDTTPLYLRHFYVERHYRRRGIGTAAFTRLRSILKTDAIDVDVLVHNAAARAFWKNLGFRSESIQMRLSK